jgi:hypothetical protein
VVWLTPDTHAAVAFYFGGTPLLRVSAIIMEAMARAQGFLFNPVRANRLS